MKNPKVAWGDFPGPCYNPQVKYGDCPETMMGILTDERIPKEDRIWAFSACKKIDDRTKRLFAVRCVRETPTHDGKMVVDMLSDPRSLAALVVAEKFANGEVTEEELAAARAGACDAACDAARAGAWAAARDAACDAAWAAARDAAWAAARDAASAAASAAAWASARASARDAARDAAWAAARDAQIEIAKSFLQ